MATYSSVLAWRIPWTDEPGGLQSIGLHACLHVYTFCMKFVTADVLTFSHSREEMEGMEGKSLCIT